MEDDLSYILQAISNETRRRILRLLREEPGLTYTKIMDRLGIHDSGTLGFHIKKMKRLLRRSEYGEYSLSPMGVKALRILDLLNETGNIQSEETVVGGEEKIRVIEGFMNYEYTPKTAKILLERGEKAVITDIVRLVIHPMDPKLFNKTVKQITDVFICYAPSELYEHVMDKSRDIFKVEKYVSRASVKETPGSAGLIETILKSVLSSLSIFLKGFTFKKYVDKDVPLDPGGKYKEYDIGDVRDIYVELRDAILILDHGKPSVRIKTVKNLVPNEAIYSKGDSVEVRLSKGVLELSIPDDDRLSLEINVRKGIVTSSGDIYVGDLYLDTEDTITYLESTVSDGHIGIEISRSFSDIKLTLKGRNILDLNAKNSTLKMTADCRVEGVDINLSPLNGYIKVRLDGEEVPYNYKDGDGLTISGEIRNSFADININKIE